MRSRVPQVAVASLDDWRTHPTRLAREPITIRARVGKTRPRVARARARVEPSRGCGEGTRARVPVDESASCQGREPESFGHRHESIAPARAPVGRVRKSRASRDPARRSAARTPTVVQVPPAVSPTSSDRNGARRTLSRSRTRNPESGRECTYEGSETKARPSRSTVLRDSAPRWRGAPSGKE
jgi:hypothetical protein